MDGWRRGGGSGRGGRVAAQGDMIYLDRVYRSSFASWMYFKTWKDYVDNVKQ